MFKVKGQRSRSQRKVMYKLQKRHNTSMVSFSDFELGVGVVINVEKDWRGVGWNQVTMHSQLTLFLVVMNVEKVLSFCHSVEFFKTTSHFTVSISN